MPRSLRPVLLVLLCALVAPLGLAQTAPLTLSYAEAGLTDLEAAAHALDRLAYGARPDEAERLAETGVAEWIAGQLTQAFDDEALRAQIVAAYPSTAMPLREQARTYSSPALRVRAIQRAQEEGLPRDNAACDRLEQMAARRTSGQQERPRSGRQARGVGVRGDSRGMGAGAMGSGGALREPGGQQQRGQHALIADLSHARRLVPGSPAARRTAIVGECLGFGDLRDLYHDAVSAKLLRATAAENQLAEVLTDFWLNHFNVSLTNVNDVASYVPAYERDAIRPHVLGDFRAMLEATALHPAMLFYLDTHRNNADADRATLRSAPRRRDGDGNGRARQQPGTNENYARELFELHTLGVNGGYTQADIEEAARALTGWKVNPLAGPLPDDARRRAERMMQRAGAASGAGYVFDPRRHDAEPKTILGEVFPAGEGAGDLDRLLDLVATHPATAQHLAFKLAAKFVQDDPPTALVDDLAESFRSSGGDLAEVMRALVEHPAFWAPEAVAAKIKTPLETVVSAIRATGASLGDPAALAPWIARMGQPLHAYQAPTGYPEDAASWVGGAALLNRMNFGLALAAGEIDGVTVDLAALARGRMPESYDAALRTYLPLLLPGRDAEETERLLLPSLGAQATAAADPLAQVVGLILGSPEFQRQ